MRSILLLVAFGCASPLTAQTPAAGAIEGQVLNAKTGAPIKRANVRLNAMGNRQQSGPTSAPQPAPVRLSKETDDQGHFAFSGLPAGRYMMSVERQGFLRQSYGSRVFNTNGTPIPLAQDQSIKGVVFKLNPQSVIAGKILDEDGEPVANVQVEAFRYLYRGTTKQWSQVANTQTSDIGEYRLANLEPGQYLVATGRLNPQMNLSMGNEPLPDKPETMYTSTYYPNGLDSTAAAPIEVGPASETRGIDIRLRKVQVFRVRGKIANMEGGPGVATVMLTPKSGGGNIRGMGQARAQDGRFEIRGVPPGSYIASARSGGNNRQLLAIAPVEVGQNHLDGVVLTFSPGVDIPGTVRVAESGVQVALTNLSVFVRPVGFFMGGSGRAKVGDDLQFVVHNVAGMRFTANVGGVPENCFVKSIKYGSQEVTEAGVDLVGSAPLEITLSTTAASVTGVVSDKDGKPVVSAIVALIPKDNPTNTSSRSTDENGTFTIKGLKPGDYRLFAWEDVEEGAYNDPEFLKHWSTRATDVKLDPSGQQSVQIKVISAEETAGKPAR